MKKILLLAYSNRNFGDDMFVKTLCNFFPNTSFYLEAPKGYESVLGNISNLTIIDENIFIRLIRRVDKLITKIIPSNNCLIRKHWVKSYDAVVYVIGALFDDDEFWNNQLEKNGLEVTKQSLWKNSFDKDTPFLLLGCNMTRINSREYVESMNYMFSGLKDICFRDKYSFNFFSQLSNTRYSKDIVFNYNCKKIEKEKMALVSVWGVLTTVNNFPQWKWAENQWEAYEKFLIEAVDRLSILGYKVYLLSLCEAEGDYNASTIIRQKSNSKPEIINYSDNIDEIINFFERADFVVGTRFHSVVMGINARCKLFPIIYESKTEQLLKDIGYEGNSTKLENIGECNIEDIVFSSQTNMGLDLKAIKEDARNQFAILEQLIKE